MHMIGFDIAALIVVVLSLIIFHTRKRIADARTRRFSLLLLSVFGSTVFDIASLLFIDARLPALRVPVLVTSVIYYIFHNSIPFLMAYYILTVCAVHSDSRISRFLFFMPWATAMGLILSDIFTGFVFFVDSRGIYRHGPGLYILYAIGVAYLAMVLWALTFRKSGIAVRQRIAYLLAVAFPLVAVVIQNRIPGVFLECLAASLSVLFGLLTLQNPNELIDFPTGLGNREAGLQYLRYSFARGEAFRLILVFSNELVNLQGVLNIGTFARILRTFSGWLAETAGRNSFLYRLDDGLFVIQCRESAHDPSAGEIVLSIARKSEEIWTVEGLEVGIPLKLALLRCPLDCADVPDVLDRIDQLIELPERLQNRHIFYGTDFQPDKRRREVAAASAIEEMLSSHRPALTYRPIHSVEKRRITMLEVLPPDPLDGFVTGRSEALRVAQRMGLARNLFDMMLSRACSAYVRRGLADMGIERIQIRLLESKCIETDWARSVATILDEAGMDPTHLCLSISESAIGNALGTFQANMETLRKTGVVFALDDFGSGYTELRNIFDLPLQAVHLERTIVHAGLRCGRDRRILEGTVTLFNRQNIPVLAEGIETEEQAAELKLMGCGYLQGSFIGAPLDEDRTVRRLSAT